MSLFFALCLTKHHKWGYVPMPYMLGIIPEKEYVSVHDCITADNLAQYKAVLTDAEIKLVKLTEQYSDKEMARVLRRKANAREFLQSLTEESIATEVRPYIERRLLPCFDQLSVCKARFFLKSNSAYLFPEDEIFYDDEHAEAVFNFRYDADEGLRYFLSVRHRNEEITLLGKRIIPLVNQPAVMAVGNRLLRFKETDAKKFLPFAAKKYISVPKQAEKKYFETFVLESIRKFRTQTEGFAIEDEPSEPIPVISLENDLRYRPVPVLRFDYGNGRKLFEPNVPAETVASLEIRDGQYVVKRFDRNREAEKRYANRLQELGLNDVGKSMLRADYDDNEQETGDLVEKINLLSDTLASEGFRVDQRFFSRKYYTGSVKLEIETSKNHDWFDVRAVVKCAGFSIPFIRFRDHILRRDRNFVLPNGEVMILPTEWLAKYEQVMLMSERNADTLRLDKRYFALVNDAFGETDSEYPDNSTDLYRTGEIEIDRVSDSVNATLRPYQRQGVAWLLALHDRGFGGCLADDMGLGKTLQALCLLQSVLEESAGGAFDAQLPENDSNEETKSAPTIDSSEKNYVQLSLFDAQAPKSDDRPPETGNAASEKKERQAEISRNHAQRASLIVMPASLIHNWANEAARFTPNLKVLRYAGPDRQSDTRFDKYHIVLTTYGIMRNDAKIFGKYKFLYAILDEAQNIRNPESITYQAALRIDAEHFLSLSGTPVENSLTDLWAQMNFLNRGLLGSLKFFKEHFAEPIERNNDEARRIKLQRLIRPFLLRRTKQEVAPELPALTEQVLYCEMTDTQRSLYEEEKSKARNEIIESIGKQGVSKSSLSIFRALTRLRQFAIHPAMLDAGYAADSGKFDQIVDSLENLYIEGHKALLFSSFTKHLDLVSAHLRKEQIPYAELTGKTRNREEVIDRFNNNPDVSFFLVSLKAGGTGLNLTAADYVFLLDPWWNPAAEQQAVSRTHRIGQTEKVFAYRMITSDTIEEKILRLQEKKSALADIFARSDNPFRSMSAEDVMGLFE